MPRKRNIQQTESETPARKHAKTDLIIDQLNSSNEALEALKIIASDENDEIKQLLNQGGTGKDLINIFTNSVEKLKAPEISIVFNACEVFLIHLATNISSAQTDEEAEKMKKLGIELVKEILEDHLGYIMLLLSGSNTVYQVKSSLRLLTSMVTCCSQTAKELLLKLDFEHKHWESVSKRQSGEIRQAFVQFLLSFFVINHPGIAKEFIEKKSMLASIMPGLVKDDSELVLLVLTSFKEHILENSGLSKTAKMKLFSVYNLKYFISLFDWKGPSGSEDTSEEAKKASKELIIDANIEFLVTALTSTKHGLIFQDLSYGTSGTNLNHLLFNFLTQLVEPWTRPEQAKVVIAALGSCPDQIRPYFGKILQPLWKPRASPAWYQVIDFLFAIMEAIDIHKIKTDLIDKNKQLSVIISNFCCNEKVYKEVILEALKVDNHLVKAKGLELQALLLNKIEIILKDDKVGSAPKKQILFRLQDKIPELSQVLEIWTKEVQMNSVIELEESSKDDTEINAKNDYLLPLTQIMSFYLNYYPDKYSSSDLNLEQMLQQTNEEKHWLIQLHLLKHLVTNQYGISANKQHLLTLVNIACNNFSDDNGDLATEALYGLLAKQDLCHNIMELKVWFAYVQSGKPKKLCDILTDAILNLLNNEKDTIFEEIKLELNKLGDSVQVQSSQDINELMDKLCDPDFKMESDETQDDQGFKLSPLIWTLMKSHSLMHHKAYFERCISASLLVQENPKCFLQLLKNQDFRSFPSLKNHQQMLKLPSSQHEEFDQKLEKMQLLTSLKLNASTINLEQFKEMLENEDNLDWILKDQQIINMFDPSKDSTVVELMLRIFPKVYSSQESLLKPYIKKTMQTILETMENAQVESIQTLEKVTKSLPIESQELITLLEKICLKIQNGKEKRSLVPLLDLSLSKLVQVDKWSLSNLNISLMKVISNVIEDSISQQTCSSSLLKNVEVLMQINDQFCSMMTNTHLSLACQAGYVDLVSTMIQCNPQNVTFFKKWLNLNPSQMLNFGSILLEILQKNEVKNKLIQNLKQQLIAKRDLNDLDEELLKLLVEKYQQNFDEIQGKLKLGKALLAQLKSKEQSKEIVKKIVVPIMQEITKKKLDNQDLLIEALQDLDVKLMKCSEFKGIWNDFVKTCLKYGLKNEAGLVQVLKVMFDKVLHEDKSLASETYQLICGHSQFVSILFSTGDETRKKSNLLALILTLIKADPSICSSLQVPVYLGAYSATKADRILFEILYLHETQGSVNLQAFKPLVWGQAAISKYSKNNTKVMSKSQKVSEILALIDSEKMMESALNMDKSEDSYYDAQFFLPLICQLCSSDSFVDKHLKLVESGCLALAFGCLSCKDLKMRQLALVALSRIYQQLEKARKSLSAEKQVWLHLIDVVRNGLINVLNAETRVPPRIPHLTSAFLIKSTQILSNPLDPMFKSISSFVLAKPMMDLFVVPEFLRLFHSNDVIHHQLEQEWILKVIQDGLQDELDYGILQQNFIPKLILSFGGSALASNSSKVQTLILGIVEKMCCLTSPTYDMIKNHGLLLWLLNIVHQKSWDLHQISSIICSLWNSIQANVNSQTLFELHQIIDQMMAHISDEDLKKVLLQVLKNSLKKNDVFRESLMAKLCQKAALMSDMEVDAVIIHLIHV